MSDFVCVTLLKEKHERFDAALSDIMCWLDGFVAAGGKYSPESQCVLRDIHETIKRAYDTIPPLNVRQETANLVREIRNRAIQGMGTKPAIARQKLTDIRQIADAIIDADNKSLKEAQ